MPTRDSVFPIAMPRCRHCWWRTCAPAAIANLYAAGCDVGGVSTNAYMGGLAQALVTGRIAGAAAAG